jgi:hypothetical protein
MCQGFEKSFDAESSFRKAGFELRSLFQPILLSRAILQEGHAIESVRAVTDPVARGNFKKLPQVLRSLVEFLLGMLCFRNAFESHEEHSMSFPCLCTSYDLGAKVLGFCVILPYQKNVNKRIQHRRRLRN